MITKSIAALDAGVVAQPHPEEFTVFGYQSADDAAAFFRGEPTLFAEIEDWLEDHLPGPRSLAARNDFHGYLRVVIGDPADAVTFKLAWGDVISG
jgi:hypothetical protein